MKEQALDEKTEREFKFHFKQVNFWSLHYLYQNLKDIDIEIELENEKGVRWIPDNPEHELMNHFNKDGIEYTVRFRGDGNDSRRCRCIFDRFSNYTHYLAAPHLKTEEK